MFRKFFQGKPASSEKYKHVLAAVHMVYRLVNSTFNTKELLIRLTRIICQLIGASSSCVYILDEKTKKLNLIAIFNGKVNILRDKPSQLKASQKEGKVLLGDVLIEERLLGFPLVSDENIGAVFMRRKPDQKPFDDFDRELLIVIAEQIVTAVKNIQLYELQQKVILDSIKSLGKFFEEYGSLDSLPHTSGYYQVVKLLAEELDMKERETEYLEYASILHDTGRVNVPYDILAKRSRLTPEEFKIIRSHPAKSVELIEPVAFLKPVLPIILYHHERYDGKGYPSGLKGEEIPLGARVMAVVDAFEAMVSQRPYKKRLSVPRALRELKKQRGTQFDPKVVDAFLRLSDLTKFRKFLSSIAK